VDFGASPNVLPGTPAPHAAPPAPSTPRRNSPEPSSHGSQRLHSFQEAAQRLHGHSEMKILDPAQSWRRCVKKTKTPNCGESNEKKKKRMAGRSKTLLIKSKEANARRETILQKVTQSRFYEWCSGFLILSNTIFIGWQTQFVAERAEQWAKQGLPQSVREPVEFLVVQVLFCFLFAADLGLRWIADGLTRFFKTPEVWWNVFDIFVVLFSLLDLLSSFAMQGSDGNQLMANVSLLRVMRVVRIVRVAKIIRVMRFFRELRMMIYSILGSIKSLMWSLIVLNITFFIFGISLTIGTIDYLKTSEMWRDTKYANLSLYFGTLDRSILSLYMAMSGGRDWGEFYDVLLDLPGTYRLLFLAFISFAIFAVVNIVTGVFVENALQSNQTDRDIIVHEELEAKKEYLKSMQDIFEEMDDDNTGLISIDEFETKLDDERVIAYFNALKLDVSDARTLFTLLDYDQSGEIAIDEFLVGCHKLKGESRSLDIAIMQYEIRWLKEAFLGFADFSERSLAAVETTVCGSNKNGDRMVIPVDWRHKTVPEIS